VGRREERVRIGSYAVVQAVAVSRRYVYSATDNGITVYDRLLNAWLPPLGRDDGFTDQQITVLAGDPVEDALWFGVPGAVVVYRPLTEQLQRTFVTGVPDVIAFDRSGTGDAIVRSGGSWTRVSRVGIATPLARQPAANTLIVPSTLPSILARFPALRSQSSLLLRNQQSDRALRNYPVISGAASPERGSEVWLGTNGDGLYRVDPTFLQATPLPFGLIEPGVGALALSVDGVWVAGLGQSSFRAGLTFASNDLQRWRWIDGTLSVPLLGVRTYSMTTRGSRAWLGTNQGLVRVRLDGSEDVAVWGGLDGLTDSRVLSVATRSDGAWAGTARGLVFVNDSTDTRNSRTRGLGARVLANTAVNALQFTGDTLWIGTEGGLFALPSPNEVTGGTLTRPLGNDPALRRPIRALAWSDSVLLAAGDDAVLSLAPRAGREPSRVDGLDARVVGQVTRVGIDERSMWLAGTDGVIIAARSSNGIRVLRVGSDLPGAVLDVVASRDWMWVGTTAGLVRFRRAADGGLL